MFSDGLRCYFHVDSKKCKANIFSLLNLFPQKLPETNIAVSFNYFTRNIFFEYVALKKQDRVIHVGLLSFMDSSTSSSAQI